MSRPDKRAARLGRDAAWAGMSYYRATPEARLAAGRFATLRAMRRLARSASRAAAAFAALPLKAQARAARIQDLRASLTEDEWERAKDMARTSLLDIEQAINRVTAERSPKWVDLYGIDLPRPCPGSVGIGDRAVWG